MTDLSALAQGTDEWRAARLGKVTASRIADVIAKTKTGWGASRKNYLAELVAERLTGNAAEQYTNAAMQWGVDTEPRARSAYEFYRDETVTEVGLIAHPTIEMSACSPDGLVGADGMIEVKCPNTATHIDTLLGEPIADKYIVQMQWQMACASRAWCDFVSYDPRLPERLALFVCRIPRDAARIAELEKSVVGFLAELDQTVTSLENLASDARSSTAAKAATSSMVLPDPTNAKPIF